MKTSPYLVWTLAAMMSAGIEPGFACECLPKPPPKEALSKAGIVFSGRVVGRAQKRVANKSGALEMREFLFEVSAVWKGYVTGRISIVTGLGGSDCGYNFEMGKNYLVYASTRNDWPPETNICMRTAPEDVAGEDLKELGPSTKPK